MSEVLEFQTAKEIDFDEQTRAKHIFSIELQELNGVNHNISTESFSVSIEAKLKDPDDDELCTTFFSKPVLFVGSFKHTVFSLNIRPPQNKTTDLILIINVADDSEDGGANTFELGFVKFTFKKSIDLLDLLSKTLPVLQADSEEEKTIGKARFVLADSSQTLVFKAGLPLQPLKTVAGMGSQDNLVELKAVLTKEKQKGKQPTKEEIDSTFESHLAIVQSKEVSINTNTIDMMVEMHKLSVDQKLFLCLVFITKKKRYHLIADFSINKQEIDSTNDFEVKRTLSFRKLSDGPHIGQTQTVEMKVSRLSSVSLTQELKNMYGLDFCLSIAIDMTASNLNNSSITSDLHDLNNGQNPYQKVIDLVGKTIFDQSVLYPIPVYFFGLQTEMFASRGIGSGDETRFVCEDTHSITEVKQKYEEKVRSMRDQFGATTSFTEFTAEFFKDHREIYAVNKSAFSMLLIITDGILEDKEMSKMIDLISEMAHHNVSIIIVGVGSADFSNMEKLDGDAGEDGLPSLKNTKGKEVERDIVQFVQFEETNDPVSIKEKIFYELPHQIISFQQQTKSLTASQNNL